MNRLDAYAQIAAQAGRGELVFPTSVNAALQLQLALDDPHCHIEQAIKLVLAEPLLAARTVALANASAFSRPGQAQISDVRTAVMRVGYQNLQAMVAAMVVRQFGSRITDPRLRAMAEQLWEHCAQVAALAHVIARRITGVNPDMALFAAIVHEVGGFYLLSRAEQYPGLLDEAEPHWNTTGAALIATAVMDKLALPAPVRAAIEELREGMLRIPPETLGDTLLLAHHCVALASPLERAHRGAPEQSESVIDFVIDNATLQQIVAAADADVRSISAALLA